MCEQTNVGKATHIGKNKPTKVTTTDMFDQSDQSDNDEVDTNNSIQKLSDD